MYTLIDDVGGDRLILPFSLAQRCGELHVIVADPSLFIPTRHCLGTHAPTVGELFILPIDSSSCCGFQTDSTMKNRRDAETVQPWADLHPHSQLQMDRGQTCTLANQYSEHSRDGCRNSGALCGYSPWSEVAYMVGDKIARQGRQSSKELACHPSHIDLATTSCSVE